MSSVNLILACFVAINIICKMDELKKLFSSVILELYWIELDAGFMQAKKGEGHFSFASTMKLAKDVWKPWLVIAEEIRDKIWKNKLIWEFIIVSPWFLNFWLSDYWLLKRLEIKKYHEEWVVVIDYWGENIAKEMSIGHLRSNIIWSSIAKIYSHLGWKVVKDNHLWDYWTQFWKLIYAYKLWWNDKIIESNPIEELNNLYVRFHKESKDNPTLDDLGREEFKRLENWDKENHDIWQRFVDFSLNDYKQIYSFLWSEFDTYLWESFYLPMLPELIEELNNIWVIWEEWAKLIEFDNMPPLMYLKKDWASLYATRDLATIKYRMRTYSPKKIIYVVGNDQSLQFKQTFATASRLNWPDLAELFHAKFWLVRLPEWKMSTREWRVIKLRDLIETGLDETRRLLETKDSYKWFSTEEKADLVLKIAIWAIKFNDLYQDRETDITFNWEKALSLEWASGPYMQYAYVRTMWILNKIWEINLNPIVIQELPLNDKEKELIFHLWNYNQVVERAWNECKPHFIARYIYELSQVFNSFYAACPVMHETNEVKKNLRIYLVKKTGDILKQWLELLWIPVPNKM